VRPDAPSRRGPDRREDSPTGPRLARRHYTRPAAAPGIREITARERLLLFVKDIVRNLNRFPTACAGHGNPSGGTSLPASAAFAPPHRHDGRRDATTAFVCGRESDWVRLAADPERVAHRPAVESITDAGVGLNPEQFYSWAWAQGNRTAFTSLINSSMLDYPTARG
jgi:hypothetical protein